MTICAICGKLLTEENPVCPNGHKIMAEPMPYAKELQRSSHTVDVQLANGLMLNAKIQMVTEDGIYLDDLNLFDEPLKYSWDEITSISKSA